MNWLRLTKSQFLKLNALLVVGVLCFLNTINISQAGHPQTNTPEKYLFVWAGDQARQALDFLAVVNFDESSPNYGRVITTVPLRCGLLLIGWPLLRLA